MERPQMTKPYGPRDHQVDPGAGVNIAVRYAQELRPAAGHRGVRPPLAGDQVAVDVEPDIVVRAGNQNRRRRQICVSRGQTSPEDHWRGLAAQADWQGRGGEVGVRQGDGIPVACRGHGDRGDQSPRRRFGDDVGPQQRAAEQDLHQDDHRRQTPGPARRGGKPAPDSGAKARGEACNDRYSFSRIRPAWTASNTASLRELTASLR
jgi:hypothetical protein